MQPSARRISGRRQHSPAAVSQPHSHHTLQLPCYTGSNIPALKSKTMCPKTGSKHTLDRSRGDFTPFGHLLVTYLSSWCQRPEPRGLKLSSSNASWTTVAYSSCSAFCHFLNQNTKWFKVLRLYCLTELCTSFLMSSHLIRRLALVDIVYISTTNWHDGFISPRESWQ
jgi:hypothetical protein